MSSTEIIPETVSPLPEPPRLLVEWSSPWEEFKSAIRPALRRPGKQLAGEAPTGLFPYRGLLASWLAEFLLLWLVIVLPSRLESLRPYAPPPMPKYDVLYYYGNELPRTQDQGGAQAGASGRAGGQQAHHPTQTIRVARGEKPSEKVVDAPKLNLPRSDSSVANLLAFKSLPAPLPAEGLRSSVIAPVLPAISPVPPTPELNSSLNRNPNSLTAPVVPPAPEVSRTDTRHTPALSASVIAPAPDVARDKMRASASPVATSIIAPAPTDAQRDLASSRVPLTQTVSVVAPPVSAPTRDLAAAAKLSLPAPAVVAPPPSQVSRDLNSWGGSAIGNVRANPVPPPPSMAGGGSLSRNGAGGLSSSVVPPPVSVEGGAFNGKAGGGRAGGVLAGSAQVVPPPPSLGGGAALSGSGRGTKGSGRGGPLDLGTAAAPPSSSSGSAPGAGVVVSTKPGTQVGVPNSGSGGSLAMSPTGTAKTGLGGSGGGAGIGKGNGPGSGMKGEGSGAGKEGSGRGSDPNARAGISPYPGPGGAGQGAGNSPTVPGVYVQGGNTITLPSFGAPGGDAGPGRSSASAHKREGVTVVATSRSGGVFNYYGMLKGDNYSIYIETSLGIAVMQYSDPAAAAQSSKEALTEPEPIRKDLPNGLRPTRVVIACILDRSGVLKDLKVLEPGAAETTSKILAALPNWKFQPATRGNAPVEVNAIIGFGIDTR